MKRTVPSFRTPRRMRRTVAEARQNGFTRPNGFTLMELLIVISIILILMLIAIPTAGKIKRHADELSAMKSLQTLQQAESMYSEAYPTHGYACSIQALGGDPKAGPSTPEAAGLISGELTTGVKSGYVFNITGCIKATANNTERITAYTATAVPLTPGKTGDRGFCLEGGGSMMADPTGGTNCTQMAQ